MPRTIARKKRFVVCVRDTGYSASLELRKIYHALPDADAAAHNLVRVIDESGEDYLYPEKLFLALDLPQSVEIALRLAAGWPPWAPTASARSTARPPPVAVRSTLQPL